MTAIFWNFYSQTITVQCNDKLRAPVFSSRNDTGSFVKSVIVVNHFIECEEVEKYEKKECCEQS